MNLKHTPGPWRVELDGYDSDYGYVVEHAGIWAEDGFYVAAVSEPYGWHTADVAANASLIAAAPELLTALQCAVTALERLGFETHSAHDAQNLAAMRAAITKATTARMGGG